MIETEHRRVAASNSDQWLADLAPAGGNRDVYAESRETKAYGAAGVLRSREANMTDRYDRNGHELRDGHPETVSKHAQADQAQSYQDGYYDDYQDAATTRQAKAYVFDDEREEQGPEWVYDEQRGIWLDRDGNPYVETYPEGEEDRYAPAADDEYLAPRAEARMPRRKSRGSAVSLAALVLVASIGGGLAYVWKKGGFVGSEIPGIGSAPPVIKASSDPVKIKPAENAAAASQPTHEIFNRNNQTASVANERLVRHEEQPVAVVPTRPEGAGAPAAPAPDANATRPVTTSNITLPNPDGTATSDQTASSTSDTQVAEVPGEPRRVRTIKIMPDNSVVTGDAPITEPPAPQTRGLDVSALAPTSPVNQPSSEATPSAQMPSAAPAGPQASANAPADVNDPAPVATVPAGSAATSPEAQAPAVALPGEEDGGATTVVEPTQTQAAPPAVPPVRPRHMPAAPKPTQVATAEPAAAPTAAPVSNGSYVVQVSSQRSPADAQNAFQSLQRRFGGVLGGMKASIRKVELPDRGTYYRVRVGGWSTPAEATAFCGKLKAAGGDCVIARN